MGTRRGAGPRGGGARRARRARRSLCFGQAAAAAAAGVVYFRGARPRPGPSPEPLPDPSLLEPPRRLILGVGSGSARRRTQDRDCMPEDQAHAAMVS